MSALANFLRVQYRLAVNSQNENQINTINLRIEILFDSGRITQKEVDYIKS